MRRASITSGSSEFPHDDVNSYTLTLTAPLPGDDFEPNDTQETATALQLGTTVSTFLFTRNDVDWYRIVTPADAHLVVNLDFPLAVSYKFSLWNGTDSRANSSDSEDGHGEEMAITLVAGTYQIAVESFGVYSQDQRYSLTAASGSFTDSFEPNNSRPTARRAGPGTLRAKVYTSNDDDWYRFNVAATGTVSVVLEVPPSADLRFDLMR